MKLVFLQNEFLNDLARLIDYIQKEGWLVTGGELYRPYDMQLLYYYGYRVRECEETTKPICLIKDKKLSWTKSSKHLQRLAIDLNFFKPVENKYVLTYNKNDLKKFGEFWERLSPLNRWGGFWKKPDTSHFQKTIRKD